MYPFGMHAIYEYAIEQDYKDAMFLLFLLFIDLIVMQYKQKDLNPCPTERGYFLFEKHCRSRLDGF